MILERKALMEVNVEHAYVTPHCFKQWAASDFRHNCLKLCSYSALHPAGCRVCCWRS